MSSPCSRDFLRKPYDQVDEVSQLPLSKEIHRAKLGDCNVVPYLF